MRCPDCGKTIATPQSPIEACVHRYGEYEVRYCERFYKANKLLPPYWINVFWSSGARYGIIIWEKMTEQRIDTMRLLQ